MSPATIKITGVSVVLFAGALAAFIFMFLQTNQQGDKLQVQIEALQQQRAQEESFFRLRRVAEESQEQRAQLQSYFFTNESESINFLNQVEQLAPEAGVTLETNSLNLVEEKGDESQWVEIGFTFTGSRERVQNFLKILEVLPYVSTIQTVDMSAKNQTYWQAEVLMRVRVLSYDE